MTADGNGEWMVLSAVPPGQPEENIAVYLVDLESGTPWRRFRKDLSDFCSDEADVLEALEEDLVLKAAEIGAVPWMDWLEDNASHFIRVVSRERGPVRDFRNQLDWLYHRHIKPKVLPFRTHLPRYGLVAAAGRWGPERDVDQEPQDWVEAPPTLRGRLSEDLFVAQVTGRSMEPLIPADSWCVFRGGAALGGSRQGKRVLVLNYGEPGEQRATVKRYESVKRQVDEDRMEQLRIILHPLNPEFEAWELDNEDLYEGGRFRVVGEFVAVLDDREI
ncbi:MAG: S24 family peptidase [Bryobacteraceae bacterium]|nr:S24 family peptidase [Bryobacteraceae bacterium]